MAKRLPLYQQADQIAMDDVAIFPIYYGTSRYSRAPSARLVPKSNELPATYKNRRSSRSAEMKVKGKGD